MTIHIYFEYIFSLSNTHKVNAVDGNSLTPLFYAAEQGYETIIDMLLTAGADVYHKDPVWYGMLYFV